MFRTLLVSIITSFVLLGCNTGKTEKSQVKKEKQNQQVDSANVVKRDMYGTPVDSFQVADHEIKRNESLYVILDKFDFTPKEIHSFTQKARNVLDFNNLRPGQRYRTYASVDDNGISRLVWQPNKLEYVVFDWAKDSLKAYRAAHPLKKKKSVASGEVSSSLYQTISDKGASPLLAYKMADIFAWQINFFGLREGDSFNVLYEKQFIGDDFWSVGDVLAATFNHRGEIYQAYKYSNGEVEGYFTNEGKSVEKALLKAPFKFSQRISSPFSRNRYHPILKKRRPHYGIDYAAPRGTPVLSVGDGIVTKAEYGNGSGYIVKIEHNGVYQTAYMHLRGFADGIHRGAKVEQGQVIAYVGNTGMSTGPHLHYSLYKNNQPVNALGIDLPSSESIPDSLMEDFKKVRDSLNKQLESKNSNSAGDTENESMITYVNNH
ncbi:M23 family metallopeptidase [Fodinibius saliphilus]|uniref:M23 family metallopeptidase n=1 Tax=Fodinibius saliphilus TaxID=1920650 RepID=UPI001108A19C|nr:peptidoglycan DD-metalloendopeptidase family protein [Fodinibius saliphilus]